MTLVATDQQLVPYANGNFLFPISLLSDPNHTISNVRTAALASLSRNRIALAKTQPSSEDLTARLAVLQAKTHIFARIGYRPLKREAKQRREDTSLKSFGIIGTYEAYGSTDGDWRKVALNRRVVLPPGCVPRRSKHLMND
jgi:hypothetical protein